MIAQNMVWFTWPPPLLRTTARMSSGIVLRLRSRSSGECFAKLGMLLDSAVEVVDVGGVMLVVMKLHRFGIDVRFKRGVVVGKWWQFVSQNILLD